MVDDVHVRPADEPKLPDPYEIVSIRSVAPPNGMVGLNWHRYEISQGSNRIIGYRSGATEIVQEAVELIVLRLNMRRLASRGRVHVVLQSRASRN